MTPDSSGTSVPRTPSGRGCVTTTCGGTVSLTRTVIGRRLTAVCVVVTRRWHDTRQGGSGDLFVRGRPPQRRIA